HGAARERRSSFGFTVRIARLSTPIDRVFVLPGAAIRVRDAGPHAGGVVRVSDDRSSGAMRLSAQRTTCESLQTVGRFVAERGDASAAGVAGAGAVAAPAVAAGFASQANQCQGADKGFQSGGGVARAASRQRRP